MAGRHRLRASATLCVAVVVISAVVAFGAVRSPSGAASPGWQLAAPALPPAPARAKLTAVACPRADVCLAVGQLTFYSGIVAMRSVGTAWSFVPAPTPQGTSPVLTDLACASATKCFAVGKIGAPTDSQRGLMERWDGSHFKIVTAPKPAGAKQAQLTGVSCPGPKFCMAIGTYGTTKKGFLDRPYTARWNGKAWSIAAIPAPERHATFSLTRVSCWSASGCFAVGNYSSSDGVLTFTERWNGTKWSIVPSPSPPQIAGSSNDNKLVDVSCPVAKFCFAVGYYLVGDNLGVYSRPYAVLWNGTQWKLRTIGVPSGSNSAQAVSVSCASGTACLTGGFHANFTSGDGGSWVTRWNGTRGPPLPGRRKAGSPTWRAEPRPSVSAWVCSRRRNSRSSCSWRGSTGPRGRPTPRRAVVRSRTSGTCRARRPTSVSRSANVAIPGRARLTERWDGSHWSIVAPALPAGAKQSVLRAVSCSSATNCIAVGDHQQGGLHVFAERWDGTKWTLIAAPSNVVTSLSCLSSTFCMAVGLNTLRWNGTTWAVSDSSGAADVSCVSTTSCMAVGSGTGNPSLSARHWNGTAWSNVATVTPPGVDPELTGVSCPSPTSCTAVGDAGSAQGNADFTFVEQWNGASWSLSSKPTVPTVPGSYPLLQGVSCATTTSCAAVGKTGAGTLILQWDGAAWSIAPSPNRPDARFHTLSGVSCPSPTNCFAAGSAVTDRYSFPLILQYS